ncbi:hypothetical protein [Exiguobacterium sp. s160]|uniref:hypothetical protein n=1 Tax=Exiguobacterium sp. s160 TaxID=2751265 RepID=UPI001BE656EB|nr:hypothetical protein [Exiguobacterium sp. s160]
MVTKKKSRSPFLVQTIPFLLSCVIFGPIGLVLVLFYWRKIEQKNRWMYVMIAIVFTLFDALDYFTDGLLYYLI